MSGLPHVARVCMLDDVESVPAGTRLCPAPGAPAASGTAQRVLGLPPSEERPTQRCRVEIISPSRLTDLSHHQLATCGDAVAVAQEGPVVVPCLSANTATARLPSRDLRWSGMTPTPWCPREVESSPRGPFTRGQFPLDLIFRHRLV